MKPRTNGFLSEKNISHDSEIFDYIAELHDYLWRVVRAVSPGSSGMLTKKVDEAITLIENAKGEQSGKPDTVPDSQGEASCVLCGTMTMERHGGDVYYCKNCGATIKLQSRKAERPRVTWEDVKALAERMAEYPSQKRIEEWLTEAGVLVE